MKNNLIRPFRLLATQPPPYFTAWACQDDVDLPMPTLRMSTPTLVAPSFATTLSFSVDSNCDWEITVEAPKRPGSNSPRPQPSATPRSKPP
ncbi:MAG: hypothetical protein ACLSGF_13660 [Alistipes onderdonkii]